MSKNCPFLVFIMPKPSSNLITQQREMKLEPIYFECAKANCPYGLWIDRIKECTVRHIKNLLTPEDKVREPMRVITEEENGGKGKNDLEK